LAGAASAGAVIMPARCSSSLQMILVANPVASLSCCYSVPIVVGMRESLPAAWMHHTHSSAC
jgi:hypothetical protein